MEKLVSELKHLIIENSKNDSHVTLGDYITLFAKKGYSQKDVEQAFSKVMIELGNKLSEYYD